MAEMLFNWVTDRFASSDIIDLYFVLSDLVDVLITDEERCETAYFDSMAAEGTQGDSGGGSIPNGKLVL